MNKSMKKAKKQKTTKSPEKEGELQSPGKRKKTLKGKGAKKGKLEEIDYDAEDPMENKD